MWWWREVRKANIPLGVRDELERYGEMTVATALATPMDVATSPMYSLLHADRHHTLAWLTERRDIHERREDRLETVEWAILVWVVLGVIADIILVIRGP